MFKFHFNLDDDNTNGDGDGLGSSIPTQATRSPPLARPGRVQTCREIPIHELLACLPSLISYSPLVIPCPSGQKLKLARRDIFDARDQLISEYSVNDSSRDPPQAIENTASALEFLDAPSDLVPGVYEGGLKTWECSLDLSCYLHSLKEQGKVKGVQGKRVLELGCGTAIPLLYLLQDVFSSTPSAHDETHIHLQDYNPSVIKLLTFPNILLTWYMSIASVSYRASEPLSSADPSSRGQLSVTPALLSAFLSSLAAHALTLRFFAGAWDAFDVPLAPGTGAPHYDLVLTSETIYQLDSLPSLVALLRSACGPRPRPPRRGSSQRCQDNDLDGEEEEDTSPLCLVAAKVLYFGVGGGVDAFVREVEGFATPGRRGRVQTVWEHTNGIARKIMRVIWEDESSLEATEAIE